MSGIYIPGMEMPTGCDKCPFEYSGDCYGGKNKYIMDIDEEIANGVRHKGCPLIPVPDHGRLVDADALVKDNAMAWGTEDIIRIAKAPTIVPADGGAE